MRYRYLDGLRGWASIMVLFNHVIDAFLARIDEKFYNDHARDFLTRGFLSNGPIAIYIFFVISGFVLSIEYVHKRDTELLTKMALRRYPRLLIPVFAISVVSYILMISGAMYNEQAAAHYNDSDWIHSFYHFSPKAKDAFLDFPFYQAFFAFDKQENYNPNLWTMPIELGGSMMVFALLALLGKYRIRWLINSIVLLIFIRLHSPFMALIGGMLLAELHVKCGERYQKNLLCSLMGVAFACFVIIEAQEYNSYLDTALYARPALAFLLVASVLLSPVLQWFLSLPFCQFLGKISFPLYLVHIPIICSVSAYTYYRLAILGEHSNHYISNVTLVVTLVTCLVASLLMLPVEKFAIRVSHRLAAMAMRNEA